MFDGLAHGQVIVRCAIAHKPQHSSVKTALEIHLDRARDMRAEALLAVLVDEFDTGSPIPQRFCRFLLVQPSCLCWSFPWRIHKGSSGLFVVKGSHTISALFV